MYLSIYPFLRTRLSGECGIVIVCVCVRRKYLRFSMCHFGPYSLIYKLVQFFYINIYIDTYTKNAHFRYMSPPRGGATSHPIRTKFGRFVELDYVVNPAKFGIDRLKRFRRARVQITVFSIYRASRS